MLKISLLFIVVFASSGCLSLPKKHVKAVDCKQIRALHPKDQALCAVKGAVANRKNKSINSILNLYEKKGLQSSEEYNVSFLGGKGGEDGVAWAYIVTVDFYDFKTFRSLVVIVQTFDKKRPFINKVFSAKTVESWLK